MPAQRATLRARWGQLPQPQAQRRIISPMVLVVPGGSIEPEQPTRSAYADGELAGDGPHQRARAGGRQAFFL